MLAPPPPGRRGRGATRHEVSPEDIVPIFVHQRHLDAFQGEGDGRRQLGILHLRGLERHATSRVSLDQIAGVNGPGERGVTAGAPALILASVMHDQDGAFPIGADLVQVLHKPAHVFRAVLISPEVAGQGVHHDHRRLLAGLLFQVGDGVHHLGGSIPVCKGRRLVGDSQRGGRQRHAFGLLPGSEAPG